MKVNTALSFLLGGSVLLLIAINQPIFDSRGAHGTPVVKRLARCGMTIMLLIASLTIAEYLAHIDIGIDNILIADHTPATATSSPGRMAPATALGLFCLSTAFFGYMSRKRIFWFVAQALSMLAIVIAYLAILGYLYDVDSFYRVYVYSSVALHTAILMALLAMTVMLLRPMGIVRLVAGTNAGGILARRLLPAALIVFPLMAWFQLRGQELGYYSTRFGMAIYVVIDIALFSALIWWTGYALYRNDIERNKILARLAAKRAGLLRFSAALEHSNIELRRFAYVASHDLQTPLRSIMSFTQLMQRSLERKLDAETRDWMQRVITNAGRMQALIQNLLEYSRIGMQSAKLAEVNMNEVLQSATDMLHATIVETGAEVVSTRLPTVHGDISQLTQLLQNLIGNAIKYKGDNPPRIHISVAKNDGMYLFAIKDNGIGIDGKHKERIFEIFQRLHSSRAYQGTGIGLAICRRVVESHGGKIWVESQPGVGSTFYFTLPSMMGSNHEHSN